MKTYDGAIVCCRCSGSAHDVIEEDDYEGTSLLECVYCGMRTWHGISRRIDGGTFVIKYGRYAGKTLAQLDREKHGRKALLWLMQNAKSEKLRSIIEAYIVAASQA